jgi:hypothetical protein
VTDPERHLYLPDLDRQPPQRPSADRARRLRELAEWHDEWVSKWADRAGFRPEGRKPDSDYNLHHVDLDAPAEAQEEFYRRAREIMGE